MRRYRLVLASALVVLLALAVLQLVASTLSARDEQVPVPAALPRFARIYYDDIARLGELGAIDLLEYNNLAERYVLAVVNEEEIARLRALGWRVVPDGRFQHVLQGRNRFYDGYQTIDELYASLRSLQEAHPSLSDLVAYGQSHCGLQNGCVTPGGDPTPGKELLAFRVTNKAIPGYAVINGSQVVRGLKPVFFLVANLHARELTTTEIAVRWLELLLQGYGSDPDITWLIDWHDLWIVPAANPDGHWVAELGTLPPYSGAPLMHRKNFNQDADGDGLLDCEVWPSNTILHAGVDLNRNHSFAWQDPGQTTLPCTQTYAGTAPASEPEIAALQALLQALFADQRGPKPNDRAFEDTTGLLISLHNFSELVLYPWSHSSEPAPDYEQLQAIAGAMAALNGYRACQPHECLYLASGTTDDWAYGELGIPAFTFEIGTPYQGFMPPYSVIDAEQWPENRPALILAAGLARAPYRLINGPEVVELGLTGTEDGQLLTAVIDDSARGADIVAGAEYAVDIPFWEKNSISHPLEAADGQFDSPRISVFAALDLNSLPVGQHTIFVRGFDSAGNPGLTRAIFFDSPYPQTSFVPFVAASSS